MGKDKMRFISNGGNIWRLEDFRCFGLTKTPTEDKEWAVVGYLSNNTPVYMATGYDKDNLREQFHSLGLWIEGGGCLFRLIQEKTEEGCLNLR